MQFSHFPRVPLAHLPTPLEELTILSRELGGPHLFIKRDDCTGLATGGNKTRKLEFLVGDARARGADTLITEGGVQSNHCRQTAAAAARCGMDCVLVLNRTYTTEPTGNLLLDQIFGARLAMVETSEERRSAMASIARELRAAGKTPYVIPTGGSNGIGAIGYANALLEIEAQANERGIVIDAIVTASGSGGTQGGLEVGRKLLHSQARIIGISDGETRADLTAEVLRVARETVDVLGVPLVFTPNEITVYDEYYGEGYGIPTPAMVDAVRMLARTEGILLDPVYSGKAMAGLIDLIRKGVFTRGETVVFLHTGGTPALFAYREAFEEEGGRA
jgi:L-cysteate sulfo-lyase